MEGVSFWGGSISCLTILRCNGATEGIYFDARSSKLNRGYGLSVQKVSERVNMYIWQQQCVSVLQGFQTGDQKQSEQATLDLSRLKPGKERRSYISIASRQILYFILRRVFLNVQISISISTNVIISRNGMPQSRLSICVEIDASKR